MKRSVYTVCAGLMAAFASLATLALAEDSSGTSDQTTLESRQPRPQATPAEVQRAVTTLNQRPGYQNNWQPQTIERSSFVQAAADSPDNKEALPPGAVVYSRENPAKHKSTSENSIFRLVNAMFQEPTPGQPEVAPGSSSRSTGSLIGTALGGFGTTPASDQTTSKTETQQAAPTDVASALTQTNNVQNVEVQHRSPVSTDPYVRGYRGGQVYTQADGVYWTPARRDLDSMLSKIDPDMMQDVSVIPGPYGLRYGPGLAFIDVTRESTPRYECGFESHFDTAGSVRSNGGQIYGRETVTGGDKDWGFIGSYGERSGSDYTSGDGTKIPSSYHNQDAWGELSYDINRYRRIDIAYQRLDQSNTEIPCEFFDIAQLDTYGVQLRVADTNPMSPWTSSKVEAWYNRTEFRGVTPLANPGFPVIERVNFSLTDYFGTTTHLTGTTQGALSSSGARVAATFGELDDTHVSVGADLRYVEQIIGEQFSLWQGASTPFDSFDTNMPHSWMIDPGVYVEWAKPLTDALTTSVGARLDFVTTRARASDLLPGSSLAGADLNQENTLYAFYYKDTYKLNDHWTLDGGFGFAERPTTLIERYADGLFISSLQSGFTRVIGDPDLKPERAWQVDLGVSTEQERWRGRAAWYYSWVLDYVTYFDDSVANPQPFADARLLNYMNTPLASLTGFELYGEYDLLPRMSTFGKASYIQGRDETLDTWLPGISPFEGTVGLRFHNPDKERRWNIDMGARMVTTQNDLGTIRMAGGTTVVEERTPGFTTCFIRGNWDYSKHLRMYAGIDNVFNRNYQEHLDLRLSGPSNFGEPTTRVLATGISPFCGVNWIF